MEKPASGSEDDQFLAAQAHLMKWQEEGGERRLAAHLRKLSGYRLSRDEVDELVRDTVARVCGAIRRGQYVKRENVAFCAFVHTVGRNVYINEGRRKGKHTLSLEELSEKGRDLPASLDALETQIEAEEFRHHLYKGLEALTPQERYVVTGHFVGELQYPEIAKELGKSPAAVRQIASRAIGKLRALLNKLK